MAFTIKTAEGIAAADKFLETNSYLSGGNSPGAADRELLNEIDGAKFVPCHKTAANLYGWWWTLALFREPARALWGAAEAKKEAGKKDAAAPKKEEKKEEKKDELDDLFGEDEDPEAEAKAKEQAAKRKKEAEEAKKKKAPKAPIICKSEVIFDVKGHEADDDFDALAAKIRGMQQDGLVWKDSYRIVPIGFGMNKLEIGMIIEDDKVSTDDIFEKIQEWEEVQSIDIVKFGKA